MPQAEGHFRGAMPPPERSEGAPLQEAPLATSVHHDDDSSLTDPASEIATQPSQRRAASRDLPSGAKRGSPLEVLERIEFGSPEWHSLPVTDRRRGDAVRYAAECWRALNASPHVAELIADWVEWHRRRGLRAISNGVAASADWRQLSTVPTYAELERRRAVSLDPELSPAEIRATTDASWARVEAWIAARRSA